MRSIRDTGWRRLLAGLLVTGTAGATPTTSPLAILEGSNNGQVGALEFAATTLTDPALREIAAMILAADRLRFDRVRSLVRRYEARSDPDPRREALAWSVAANAAFTAGDYRKAAAHAGRWIRWSARTPSLVAPTDAVNLQSEAAAFASMPPQRVLVRSSHATPVSRDAAGLLRADAIVDGHAQAVVLDTGANVSTISATAARRLGLHIGDREASVSSGTRDAVPTRVGYADRVEIAGVVFANVVFLVLDDDQLALPIPGYSLDVILGFPVFQAMRRVRFSETAFQPFAPPARTHANRSTAKTRVHFDGSNLFVTVSIDGRSADLQLDSGAPASRLAAGFAARNADLVETLDRRDSRSFSAGGASQSNEAILRGATIRFGPCTAALATLPIEVGPSSPQAPDGTLGQDALKGFASYTIDFERAEMRLDGAGC